MNSLSLLNLEDISPFSGATGTPVLDFWWHLWVSEPEWAALFTLMKGIPFYTFPVRLRFTSGTPPAILLANTCQQALVGFHIGTYCAAAFFISGAPPAILLAHTCQQALVGFHIGTYCAAAFFISGAPPAILLAHTCQQALVGFHIGTYCAAAFFISGAPPAILLAHTCQQALVGFHIGTYCAAAQSVIPGRRLPTELCQLGLWFVVKWLDQEKHVSFTDALQLGYGSLRTDFSPVWLTLWIQWTTHTGSPSIDPDSALTPSRTLRFWYVLRFHTWVISAFFNSPKFAPRKMVVWMQERNNSLFS